LIIPTWDIYDNTQATIFAVISGACVLLCGAVITVTNLVSTAEQNRRLKLFLPLIDENARLLPGLYPVDAEMTPELYRNMYSFE
jgi:hypothetical protein